MPLTRDRIPNLIQIFHSVLKNNKNKKKTLKGRILEEFLFQGQGNSLDKFDKPRPSTHRIRGIKH